MGKSVAETNSGKLAATYTGISAGCAGIDAAAAYGIATLAKVAMPAKGVIAGLTFGCSFAFAFLALCMCKAAGDADERMGEMAGSQPVAN